jgi:arabinofuranosyltransferase
MTTIDMTAVRRAPLPRRLHLIAAIAGAFVLFGYVFAVTAWISDDSLISMTEVWNAIHGFGFTIEPGTRIQAFTHPLWVLLMTGAVFVTRELFITTLGLSLLCAMGCLALVAAVAWRAAATIEQFCFALVPLLFLSFSQGFTDYMSSGLENPLSYALVGLIALAGLDVDRGAIGPVRRPFLVMFLCSLLVLTRLDYAVLLFPLGLFLLFQARRVLPIIGLILVGVLPVLLWLAFATFYFGMPLPTTFYAKLLAGYPTIDYLHRGVSFLLATWHFDPITICLIFAALLFGWWTRSWLVRALLFGVFFYLLYIVRSGGDFMQGRFLSVPALIGTITLCLLFARGATLGRVALLLPLILAVTAGYTPIFQDPATFGGRVRAVGTIDERAFYFTEYGLLSPNRKWPVVVFPTGDTPQEVGVTCGGFGALALGQPGSLTIDSCGLGDAFIARLPAIEDPHWRIGHAIRRIPEGYEEYLMGQRTALADPGLQPLLDDIRLVGRGDLFHPKRWDAIWRLNVTFPYSYDVTALTAPQK